AGGDLFGHRVSVVLHRGAQVRHGPRPLREPGRRPVPPVPARPERAREPDPPEALPGFPIRSGRRADDPARGPRCRRRGPRDRLGPRPRRQHPERAPAARPGGARVRRRRATRPRPRALRPALRPRRRRRGPRHPGKGRRPGRHGPRPRPRLPRFGRRRAGAGGGAGQGPPPRHPRRADLRHRRPARGAGRTVARTVPGSAEAGGDGRMKLSIVDVSPVLPGESRHDALRHTIELARHAERLGYERFWVAEHHGTASVAGRAPEVLIAAIAAHTSRIRVGSGGVLLNHYSPFKVAEVFCTLNELYPGRIDLCVGRATTGPATDFALQQDRSAPFHPDSDQQIAELAAWLENGCPPGPPSSEHPIYTLDEPPRLHLLGSSPWSATAAARLGLRYVFAGFINQAGVPAILRYYLDNFRPGMGPTRVQRPEPMLAVHV